MNRFVVGSGIAGTAILLITSLTSPAAADAPQRGELGRSVDHSEALASPNYGCTSVTKITNVKSIANVTKKPSGSQWQLSGTGPVTLSLSKSVDVSNSFTGSVAPSVADVGFSVSKTTNTTESAAYNVPSGQNWVLRANQLFTAKSYHWAIYTCAGLTKSGDGTALNFLRLDYQHYRVS